MQESVEDIPSSSCRKRKKKRSFRYSTMKELKRAREYKSKKNLITKEPSSVLKALTFPKRGEAQQDSGKISTLEDGYLTLEESTRAAGTDDDEEASEMDEDDNPRADMTVVRKSKTSRSF